ncbi:glycosyltransferase involved in cell wall biosynthesis [Halospina denitrificans]|uniref:Glycosyltransferase involved in cell wall biosynthesis n=1 Tax=Halospina denitrificans TaxID=332522 RepID=A0A4R7JNR5_9GAMM|nr:glycosyltransferase involved in cell wall biosynthesis [Halospina denitrificans]
MVSVIMPAYNAEANIEEACCSVLGQTYKHIELLVIDDGSSDGTVRILERLQESDQRLKFHTIGNSGVSTARNFGINKANGTYIGFLDADDMYHPEKIQKQVNFLDSRACDAVVTGIQRFMDASSERQWLSRSFPPDLGENARFELTYNLPTNQYVLFNTVLAKRYVFEMGELYEPGLKTGEDWDLWIKLSRHFRFEGLAEPLFFYRKHETSSSAAYRETMTLNAHLSILNHAVTPGDSKSRIRRRVRSKYLEFLNNALFKGAYGDAAIIALKGCLLVGIFLDGRFYEILKDRLAEKLGSQRG